MLTVLFDFEPSLSTVLYSLRYMSDSSDTALDKMSLRDTPTDSVFVAKFQLRGSYHSAVTQTDPPKHR